MIFHHQPVPALEQWVDPYDSHTNMIRCNVFFNWLTVVQLSRLIGYQCVTYILGTLAVVLIAGTSNCCSGPDGAQQHRDTSRDI